MPNVIYIQRRIIKVEEIIVEGNDSGEVGSQIQLTAIVLPTNATNKIVFWSSSDETIATVDQSGNVELLAEGPVTITATATDGSGISGSKVLTITPAIVLPTVVTITPTSVNYTSATVGGNVTSAGNGTITERGVEYSASSNFATKTTKVLGSGTGTFSTGLTSLNSNTTYYVRAYATNEAGVAYGSVLSFSTLIYVSSIVLTSDFTAYVGDTYLVSVLSILPSNATNKNVSWSSSNTSKATVNSSGLVTLLSTGSIIITATAQDGSGVVDTINVTILEAPDPTIYVDSIVVSGNSSGNVNDYIQLTATVSPSYADNTSVTWSSSNTSKATVNQNGYVHLLESGSVLIYAIANDGSGVYAYKEIIINSANIPVTSISITGASSGTVGSTIQLAATVLPSNATNRSVIWSSSDTNKATVNSSGLVTLIAAGSVTITATATDGSGISSSKALTITSAVVPVTAISISGNSSGYVNTTIQLSAAITPSNATNQGVTWSSSNTSVATVNSSGLVTLIFQGPVTITATANDGSGVTSTKSIQVLAIARPVVSTDSVSTITARTAIVNCSISSAEGGTITYRGVLYTTASDFSGALLGVEETVNSIGSYSLQISNLNPNTTYYVRAYATNEAGSTYANILSFTTLAEQIPVTSISITGNSTGEVGTTIQLAATVLPSNATNKTVNWSSSDTSKATVNSSGLVTLIAAGNVTITATAQDGSGVSGSKALIVTTQYTARINGSSTLVEYKTTQLSVSVNPSASHSETWSSSNTSIATVNSSGLVTGVNPGNVTITATITIGSTIITEVKSIDVSSYIYATSITIEGESSSGQVGDQIQLTAIIFPFNTTDKGAYWSVQSMYADKASVDQDGLVTLLAIGTAWITVQYFDGYGNLSTNSPYDRFEITIT